MKIDIEKLSEKELVELNHRIVERLKFLESMRAHSEMMEFSIGEKVCFEAPGRGTQAGILSKYNKKTVTVLTEAGERWNISPHLLTKVREGKTIQPDVAKVIEIKGGCGKSA